MAETATQFETSPEQRWKLVWARRDVLADKIDHAAKNQLATLRGRARQVSTFLRRDGSFESALTQPDVIAFTQPLLSTCDSQKLTDDRLEWAAACGMNSLNCQPSAIQRLSQLMIYPVLIAIAGFGLYLGFAFFVATEFERMFVDFGIELPFMTRFLFNMAAAVRSFGWLIGAVLIACLLMAILWLRTPGAIISRFKFLERVFQNKRHVMAEVAFHAAQLRSIGLTAKQASAAATTAARLPSTNAEKLFDGLPTTEVPGYPLLEFAMRQPANHNNDRMLLEVADCYRRRIVTVSDWWLQWLAYGFQWVVIAFVGFIVISMFAPLFSIVSGLTG